MNRKKLTTADWIAIAIAALLAVNLGYDAYQHHMGIFAVIAITICSCAGIYPSASRIAQSIDARRTSRTGAER